MSSNLYQILGVGKQASVEEIKKQYKKLAKDNHPDKGGDADKFKTISDAYETLSDPKKRNIYDMTGDAARASQNRGPQTSPFGFQSASFFGHPGPSAGGPFGEDIFRMFNMGGPRSGPGNQHQHQHQHQQQPPPRKASDKVYELKITLREAFTGVTKKLNVSINKPCAKCVIVCPECNGQGRVTISKMISHGMYQRAIIPCEKCGGSGNTTKKEKDCFDCKGNGELDEKRTISIDIPPGADTEYKKVFNGLGVHAIGQTPGNLIIVVKIIPVKQGTVRIDRMGHNLSCKMQITFLETIVGKEYKIDHPGHAEDSLYTVNTLDFGEIVGNNRTFTIKGKGMPIQGDPRKHGDLHLMFNVMYPKTNPSTRKDAGVMKEISDAIKKLLVTS